MPGRAQDLPEGVVVRDGLGLVYQVERLELKRAPFVLALLAENGRFGARYYLKLDADVSHVELMLVISAHY